MSVKLISGGPRVGLDNTCGIAHLHGCGDPSVQARACARVAPSGPDHRGDAVEQLGSNSSKCLNLKLELNQNSIHCEKIFKDNYKLCIIHLNNF